MNEVAFKMKLKPVLRKNIRSGMMKLPEMVTVLKNAGVYDYSIYLDKESNTLFAVQKLTDDNTADKLPQNEIVRQWWEYMADIMEVNPDKSPVEVELKKVFHMD